MTLRGGEKLNITFLTDNPRSWIIPHVEALRKRLSRKHSVVLCRSFRQIPRGDIAFFLGCERIVPSAVLKRNTHNIVVHPSRLPKGRGFSPLAWQILEGRNRIPITLFEAVKEVDAGPVYLRDEIKLKGHELNDQIKAAQGQKTVELVLKFIRRYPRWHGQAQKGKPTFYARRGAEDCRLDPHASFASQFDKLRVADNERYPAFFRYRGRKYILKIFKEGR
ncbi:MAG: methionyl-tRNA formyltransferase [Candidatus Omnitrophica bacterium]|nr:methionyl-tRNA formyltransferase [Candidatus Omnitrophota bacterium]